jgi:hypothetical protein
MLRHGIRSKSVAKKIASRVNGLKGGRPRQKLLPLRVASAFGEATHDNAFLMFKKLECDPDL